MKKYPILQFEINKKFDMEICADFINEKIGDFDFGYDRIISLYPELKSVRELDKVERIKRIEEFTSKYYLENEEEIKESIKHFNSAWISISESYFMEVKKVFGSLDFYTPKTINGLVSIFKCGVIGDDLKSFQIWYKTKNMAEIRRHVAHEVLHFYYYEYIAERFPKLVGNWDMAEIFNVVILNLPQFQSIIGTEEKGYEIHESQFKKYKDIWKSCDGNLDKYLVVISQDTVQDI